MISWCRWASATALLAVPSGCVVQQQSLRGRVIARDLASARGAELWRPAVLLATELWRPAARDSEIWFPRRD